MHPRPKLLSLIVLAVIALAACGPEDGSSGIATSSAPQSGESAGTDCEGAEPHPIGQSIAEAYAVPYEQVMTWFCSGYSFDNIMVALETSQAVDVPAQTLLDMLLEKDWDAIWEEVGFTPKP